MPRKTAPLVTLRPPVEVMQPVPARALPREDGLPGGVQFELKLDGIRALAFVEEDHHVRIQSRRGNLLNDRFPQLIAPLGQLPVGLVMDGEIIAHTPDPSGGPGRIDFTALLRTHAAREAAGTQVLFVAFDVYAIPGRDVRSEPLSTRWDMLTLALAGTRPPIQQCLATTSRREALSWWRDLEPLGVEGIVCKGLTTTVEPGPAPGKWLKVRHTNTQDAILAGITGPASRPEAVLVELPNGRQEITSPRLTPMEARQVAEAVGGRLRPAESGPTRVHWVGEPRPLVEVLIGSGRHGTVRFVRVRPEE